jgi:hypothetical protein
MPVTVDHAPLETESLGLQTVGQVLSHLHKGNRLVVNVMIDGQQPDLDRLSEVRRSSITGHTVFIETTDPRQMAREVFNELEAQLGEADRLKTEASDLLQKNQNVRAMEKLSGCFTTWQNAQTSLLGTARLLKINLDNVFVAGRRLTDLTSEFSTQLRQIKTSLENRDFVSLSDQLLYETAETSALWRQALGVLCQSVA